MILYDFIKKTLETYPNSRNSDKKLAWYIWQTEGQVKQGVIDLNGFMEATSYETIRRTRQKVVETHPELCPTIPSVKRTRQTPRTDQLYQDTIDILIKPKQGTLL